MKTAVVIVGCCCWALSAQSADVAQFRGEGHLGAYPETGLLKVWPEGGPKRIWTATGIGSGYSSVISVGDSLYVTGVDRNGDGRRIEKMTALDKKGERKWQTVYGDAWGGQYPDVRTTPTFREDALYAISGAGEVVKIDAAGGKILWKVEARKNYKGKTGNWGTAESPAVDDRAVYCTVGGDETAVVALSVKDGSLIWKSPSLNDPSAYVSPTMITHRGVPQLLCATANFIFGINPKDGAIVWRVNIKDELDGGRHIRRWGIVANSLAYLDGKILLSNGYNQGGLMLELDDTASSVKILWKNYDMSSQHHGFVILDDKLYETTHSAPKFACIDLQTGKTIFNDQIAHLRQGQIITADGLLYIYDNARGNVILAKPVPEKGFEEISRFQITDGAKEHWCHPVIADKVLYIRRGDTLVAFDLKP